MPLLKACCCWKSVRDGSFACGIYTMIFYTLVVTMGSFHLSPIIENKVLFAFGLLALCLSGMCVMTSALLIVGLCADNRSLLVPWLVSVSMTTLLDIFLSLYFIVEDAFDKLQSILFVTDFLVCAINVYCLLCVLSQYKEYVAGRGRPEDCIPMEPQVEAQCMRFNWPSFQVLEQPSPEAERDTQKPEETGDVSSGLPNEITQSQKNSMSNDSVDPASSSRLVVELSRNESFSENTPSSRAAETEELPSGKE